MSDKGILVSVIEGGGVGSNFARSASMRFV